MATSNSHDLSKSLGNLHLDPTPDELDEDAALEFHEIIPTLQDMASHSIAIELWRRFISHEYPKNERHMDGDGDFSFLNEKNETKLKGILLQFLLPSSIRELVERSLHLVRVEMTNWTKDHRFRLYQPNISDLLSCCWLPNGEINNKKTARNMLSDPKIPSVLKFEIMCQYCFEDEIEKFPVESISEDLIDIFRTDALMFYWLSYLNDDLGEFPVEDGESVESAMITANGVTRWPAIEYFWDRLSVGEQTSKFVEIINYKPNIQRHFFFKMNEEQIFYILSTMPIEIVHNFCASYGQERFVMQTWICVRDFLTERQFEQMWECLFEYFSPNNDEHVQFMLDIWNHCPDDLKTLALGTRIRSIIVNFHMYDYRGERYGSIEFLIAYLSFASPKLRKVIIFESGALVPILDLSATDRLIKLCLPNVKDVLKYKKRFLKLLSIENYLCHALRRNTFENFNQFLDYFCLDLSKRVELCCRVLEMFIREHEITFFEGNWIDIIEFIDKNFLLTLPDIALEIKKLVVYCKGFCWKLLSNADDMTKMIQVVTQVFDTEVLFLFKSNALKKMQNSFLWEKFDENVIRGFVSWCCDDDDDDDNERMKKFKEKLSIDGVFQKVWLFMKSCGSLLTVRETLESLDRCLLWYFESAEDVKRFKLKKVFVHCNEGISEFSLYGWERVDVFVRITLPWFFQGDRGAIEFFKNMYKNEDIGRMI